jgi:hypothetical protein
MSQCMMPSCGSGRVFFCVMMMHCSLHHAMMMKFEDEIRWLMPKEKIALAT